MLHSKMFYNDRYYIGPEELEHIVQAAVLTAETIYLGAHVAPDPQLDYDTRKDIMHKLMELYEADILKVWSYEDENLMQLIKGSIGFQVQKSKTIVLPYEDYKDIYTCLNEKILVNIRSLYGSLPANQVQGVTEIVEGRRNLWTIALALHFDADRILMTDSRRLATQYQFTDLFRYTTIEGPALSKFLDTINIGPFSCLDIKDLVGCRKYMVSFRESLLSKSHRYRLELQDEAGIVNDLAKQLTQEYTEMLEPFVQRPGYWNLVTGLAKISVINVLGFFTPYASILDIAMFLLEWRNKRSEHFPYILVVKRKIDEKIGKKKKR